MKSKLIEKQKRNEYPCLKECIHEDGSKMIVFFIEPNRGVVIYSTWNYGNPVGEYSFMWREENFHIYNGEVILSNNE